MSIFGLYYVNTILKEAGWPKRAGLFNSTAIIDTFIADVTIDLMIDWAASLGAGRPNLALKVIALMHKDASWESEDAPDIVAFIDQAKARWDTLDNKAPHDIIQATKLSKFFGKRIKVKDLKDKRISVNLLEAKFQEGLLWGLANRNQFKTWYEANEKSSNEKIPFMQESGLKIDSLPTLSEFLKESEKMLKGYEEEIDPLPSIPEKLLKDAHTLGLAINI